MSALRTSRPLSAEQSHAELWRWPAAGAVVAVVAALLAVQVRPDPSSALSRWTWPGDVEAASTFLQAIAATSMTVLALTLAQTVVALQLASQQFSPRLLRDFLRDRATKATLTVLAGTFVFAVTSIRGLRADAPVPAVAVLLAFLLGLASLAAVLGFITHIARLLRADSMMLMVHGETEDAIMSFYPGHDDPRPRSPEELDVGGRTGWAVSASRSGFVRVVDTGALLEGAQREDAVVVVRTRPGDHVTQGTPIATLWPSARTADVTALADLVRGAVVLGYERTVEQDAGFGFRQLEDIAVKALSPGINDPVTADHAVGHMADLLVQLVGRRLGPTLHEDDEGVGRVVVPDRDLDYYLDLACGQVRRYGGQEPTVLESLLRMLRDVAACARDDAQRDALRRQVRLVLGQLSPSVQQDDADRVLRLADRVDHALEGRLDEAYDDSSGRTRTM